MGKEWEAASIRCKKRGSVPHKMEAGWDGEGKDERGSESETNEEGKNVPNSSSASNAAEWVRFALALGAGTKR
jgi:hypothetical protein